MARPRGPMTGMAGFTMVELIITMLIAVILLRIGIPAFGEWMGNLQIRASAEGVLNGLGVARSEALKRNARVMFSMEGADGGATAWTVCQVADGGTTCPAGSTIQARDGGDESPRARAGATTDASLTLSTAFATPLTPGDGFPARVIFDGRGRPLAATGWANTVRIDLRNATMSSSEERRLSVVISPTGSARLCDPSLASGSGDPRVC
ncbi:MAG: GspH/FimT family pseudopilin [Betaproteobacteria bacterium]|nr:GspH/FimT family pseudopilin [Betaproteobacteria bacterium]